MALKSKDVIRLTDIGEGVKDSLPLFEYRIAENLTEPMRVNQIYKKIMMKYPNDYINGSLKFYKNIEILESKKVIEKVIVEKEDKASFADYFNDEITEVEMSTIADDNVDIVAKKDLIRKENRRTDRWFKLNKHRFDCDDEGLEIKKNVDKELTYKRFSHLDRHSNNDDEIYIPIENPFAIKETSSADVDETKTMIVRKELHSNENNDGMVISFIKEEKVLAPKTQAVKNAKVNKNRIDRERYKKNIQKERFGDKKYTKLKETNVNILFKVKTLFDKVIKCLTRK